MPNVRDDSAGNYGSWSNPEDQSWYDWLRMKAADVQEGGKNAQTNILSALSPYGDEGWQVPPAVHEPINALMRLAENSRFPDGRLGIPNPDNAQNREDVLTGLLSMYGGNALNPLKQSEAVGAIANARLKNGYVIRPNADGSSYFAHRDRGLDVNAPDVHAGMLGRPIGAAENVYLDPTGTAHVNNVAVSPNHRRQGVAT